MQLGILSVGIILDTVVIAGIVVIAQLASTRFVEVLGHSLVPLLPLVSRQSRSSYFPSGLQPLSVDIIRTSPSRFLGNDGSIDQKAEKGNKYDDSLNKSHVVGFRWEVSQA